jgi:hypothetical protein
VLLELQCRVVALGGQFVAHAGLGQAIVAVDARNFFHHIGFAGHARADIQPDRRRLGV